MKFWKADKKTSAKITDFLNEWEEVVNAARKLAKKVGATRKMYESTSYGERRVIAFVFKDETTIDKKKWCRRKNTADGWQPRVKSELYGEFRSLHSHCVAEVMDLIGMSMFSGVNVRQPGVAIIKDTAYLVTPDDVVAKGCKRISDIQYEKTIGGAE